MTWKEGDPVWYRQIVPGGYGFASNVPATVVKTTAKRIVVRVPFADGSGWTDIAVAPHNVRPRDSTNERGGGPSGH